MLILISLNYLIYQTGQDNINVSSHNCHVKNIEDPNNIINPSFLLLTNTCLSFQRAQRGKFLWLKHQIEPQWITLVSTLAGTQLINSMP